MMTGNGKSARSIGGFFPANHRGVEPAIIGNDQKWATAFQQQCFQSIWGVCAGLANNQVNVTCMHN
jgi:hypothetical protein